MEFLKFAKVRVNYQNTTIKEITQYQLEKIKKFFKLLQTGTYVTSFSDSYFQNLILVPQLKFVKYPKQKTFIKRVYLVEKLFFDKYSFFMKVFCSVSIEKKFLDFHSHF